MDASTLIPTLVAGMLGGLISRKVRGPQRRSHPSLRAAAIYVAIAIVVVSSGVLLLSGS